MKYILFALSCFMVVGLMKVALDAMSLPEVHMSYSSNMCVKVVNYNDDNYSCENMPEKFIHIWVN